MSNLTFTIIKPKAMANNDYGSIIDTITRNGFKFVAMKMVRMTESVAKEFYKEHVDKVFFNDLIAFMTSGPIIVGVLQKENAVEDFRQLIGSTDPAKAQLGTIRRMFASSKEANAIHGSDSDASAKREIAIFFKDSDMCC